MKKFQISNFKFQISGGFTLIEILVAMTIVAVLMSISLVSFQGARKSSRDSRRKADLEQIRSALEIYRSDNKTYPASPDLLVSDYLSELPSDPVSTYSYEYHFVSENSYNLCSYLEVNSGLSVVASGDCGGDCGSSCYYKVTNP
jgi:general secretion pathway protein G